jgi:serine protease Do
VRQKSLGMIVVVAIGLAVALLWHVPGRVGHVAYAGDNSQRQTSASNEHSPDALSAIFESVPEKIDPCVVSIDSVRKVKTVQHFGPPEFFLHSPLRDFFGDDNFQQFFGQMTPPEGYEVKGLGTGLIVSKDGFILTNNHVVAGADEVTVTMSDKHQFKAKVVGTDPRTDLAVIKVAADHLQPALLGDSDTVRIGEWVVAVGHPFGLSHTITAGIVSAKGRANVGVTDYEDFIQTDAAINPGNSGGPLVNLNGEVIGINTAIATRNGAYMGVGFAIPINMAKTIMQSLINEGHVIRGWLGVAIQDLDEGLAKSFGYDGTEGALVGDVTPDTPAAKAGLQQGDIITKYAGKKVHDVNGLRSAVAATKPGTETEIEVFRHGKKETMTLTIGEQPNEVGVASGESSSMNLGMTVENLTPQLARDLGYEGATGVVVTAVEPLGLAATVGIRPNDLIVDVQGEPIKSVAQFEEQMHKQDLSKGVRLIVRSGQTQRFVFIQSSE